MGEEEMGGKAKLWDIFFQCVCVCVYVCVSVSVCVILGVYACNMSSMKV